MFVDLSFNPGGNNIIAQLLGRTVTTSVLDSDVVQRSGHPGEEVRGCLSQLDGLGLIIMSIKVAGAHYRLINVTGDGLPFRDLEAILYF